MNVFSTSCKKYIVPLLLMLLNLVLKGIFISNNSIGGDEPFSIYHAQMDVYSIISQLSAGNNPPFYEVLLHFWIKVFGISETSVRFPSLIFSTLTTLFLYKIGTHHLNKRIAIFSTLLFIFSNYQIGFAHEARVYALFIMLSSSSMFYYLNIITKPIKKNDLTLLFFSNLLLIYSHYFGFFVLFIQGLTILTNKDLRSKYWKHLILFSSVILLFYLPNLSILINRFIDSSNHGTWVNKPNGILSIIDVLRTFNNEQYGINTLFGSKPILTVLLLLLFITGIITFSYNRFTGIRILAKQYIVFSFLIPFVLIFLISFKIPMFHDRYLIFITIGYYFIIGITIEYLFQNRIAKYSISSVFLMAIILTTNPNISNKRNVRETVEKIKQLENKNTLILISPNYFSLNFAYYYDIEMFKNIHTKDIYKNINTNLNQKNIYTISHIKDVNYKDWKHIVFLDADANFSYPNNNILTTLNKNYKLTNTSEFYEVFKIYEYNLE